jgi:hypothetical protein
MLSWTLLFLLLRPPSLKEVEAYLEAEEEADMRTHLAKELR